MKLEKAIEILQYHSERNVDVPGSDWSNALKLGIEALIRTQTRREHLSWAFEPLLPGETGPEKELLAVEPLIEQAEASQKLKAEKRRGKHEPDDKG